MNFHLSFKFFRICLCVQFKQGQLCWFLTIVMMWSKFFAYKWQHQKSISTLPILNNTCSISIIYVTLEFLGFVWQKSQCFGNWISWLCHQNKGLAHTIGTRNNFMNKYNSPTKSAHKDSSIVVPTPKMFFFLVKSLDEIDPSTNVVCAWTIWFNTLKHSLEERILFLHCIQK